MSKKNPARVHDTPLDSALVRMMKEVMNSNPNKYFIESLELDEVFWLGQQGEEATNELL